MPGSVVWKWKGGAYRHATGCSMCKSSPREGFDEGCHLLPHNPVECAIFYTNTPHLSHCGVLLSRGELKPREVLKRLKETNKCVEFATCLVYESLDPQDPRRWQVAMRHILSEAAGEGKIPTMAATETPVSRAVTHCPIDPPQVCKKP
jgi:hypothetical protein